jgi:hypothetical protein
MKMITKKKKKKDKDNKDDEENKDNKDDKGKYKIYQMMMIKNQLVIHPFYLLFIFLIYNFYI